MKFFKDSRPTEEILSSVKHLAKRQRRYYISDYLESTGAADYTIPDLLRIEKKLKQLK